MVRRALYRIPQMEEWRLPSGTHQLGGRQHRSRSVVLRLLLVQLPLQLVHQFVVKPQTQQVCQKELLEAQLAREVLRKLWSLSVLRKLWSLSQMAVGLGLEVLHK